MRKSLTAVLILAIVIPTTRRTVQRTLVLPSGWYGDFAWSVAPMLATVGQIIEQVQATRPQLNPSHETVVHQNQNSAPQFQGTVGYNDTHWDQAR